ncbi:MAG: gliding motility protein GldL [Muribaculaceae bacterium]|nr:gliding motility protein GldL [Muribaculaceae bacterium]
MGKYKKYKNGIERFLSSESGQRFFNVAYSLGAAVVIWGALFKILHLPGGNTLLAIGMGTEVIMFIITAFDRPSKEYKWEEVFPVLSSKNPEDRPDFSTGFVGGAPAVGIDGVTYGESAEGLTSAPGSLDIASINDATTQYIDQIKAITEQMQKLQETTQSLDEVSRVILQSYSAITENSAQITQSSTGYVSQMSDLSRNLGGLNSIYEIQLKSISSQLENIDRVNRGLKDIRDMYEKSSADSIRYCEETEKLAHNMRQLNSVYEKMLRAMTVNMYNPAAMAAPMGGTDAGNDTFNR